MTTTTKAALLFSLALTLLIIMFTTIPETNALIINGKDVKTLAINGTCRCSATVTSPCTICPPLANIKVGVKLNGKEIGTSNTTTGGSFKISIEVGTIINNLIDVANLRVVIDLPIAGCPIWAVVSTGHLEGMPILQFGSIVNGVAILIVPALGFVPGLN